MKTMGTSPKAINPTPVIIGIHGERSIRADATEGAMSSPTIAAHEPSRKMLALCCLLVMYIEVYFWVKYLLCSVVISHPIA
jgi:hypothetical protein